MKKLAIALLVLAATPAAAQQPQLSWNDARQIRNNCAADVQKLCPGVQPGNGQIMNCMTDKKDQLSETCRQTLQSIRATKAN